MTIKNATQNENNPTILLLGNYRPSLTLARDFRKRGYDVIVGAHGCERGCQHSNAVASIWDHASLRSSPDRFVRELRDFAAKTPDLAAIFPVAEEYVRLFADYESLFKGLPPIITMRAELVQNCLDKNFMLGLAETTRVPVAPFRSTGNRAELDAAIEEIGFPLIVRPKESTKRLAGNKALILNNPDDLERNLDDLNNGCLDLLLQSKFEGKRHNIYFAAVDGNMVRRLHAVIDRTDRLDGTGLAVEGRTILPSNDLVDQTARLLKALNYSGIGCAQFLVNEQTGETSFLEINPRIAGNHALPEFAGLDLGFFNFQLMRGEPVDQRLVLGRSGIRYCWTSGDLLGLKTALLRREIGLWAGLKWFARALAVAMESDLHMVFSKSDPVPAARAIWNLKPRLARWRRPDVSTGQSTIYENS